MSALRLGLAQIDPVVGDFAHNAALIAGVFARLAAQGAELVLTPELALSGYPPEDLLLRPDFYRAARRHLESLAALTTEEGPALLVGVPWADEGGRFNAAALLRGGRIDGIYRKRLLPNYAVFDEKRYFCAGNEPFVFTHRGVRVGVVICEDAWSAGPVEETAVQGAELVVALNASPYHQQKWRERQAVVAERVRASGRAMLYANLVGGQDELVFDGASFAVDAQGALAWQGPFFAEAEAVLEWREGSWQPHAPCFDPLPPEEELYRALVLGVRDYLGKNGFPGAIIGLSGGIDSALTLCLAVDALGPERVRAVMLPSPYTATMSLEDAATLAARLGVRYDVIPIEPAMNTFSAMLEPFFAGLPPDTTEENLQSRIRGVLLMALSNKTGALVLTTGNKSEMATGYATLYGDMAGGFAVLKDVYKTQVYRLARWRNRNGEVIPERIITRPPSAELKPNQCDQDSLPPYDVLDQIIERYMEWECSPREIIAAGFDVAAVRRAVTLLKRSEYKRRQAPIGVRVSRRAFGRDWRYPITARYADEYDEESGA